MPLSDADKRALAEEVESARQCGEVAYWRLPWSTLLAVAAELDRLRKIETAAREYARAFRAIDVPGNVNAITLNWGGYYEARKALVAAVEDADATK